MSHDASDGPWDIYDETWRRARKPHGCHACGETIPVGVKYVRLFTLADGAKHSTKRCARCQAIHLHLRKLCRPVGRWPEEQLDCGETYEDEWGECPPEIAALAFALPGEVSNG